MAVKFKTIKKWIRYLHNKGFEIKNHSWSHENFTKLSKDALIASVKKTETTILETTSQKPEFFRLPYLAVNKEVRKTVIIDLGYKLSEELIDTKDYLDILKKRSFESLVERVKRLLANREKHKLYYHIILFHELPVTVEALKILIPYWQTSDQYAFELLD